MFRGLNKRVDPRRKRRRPGGAAAADGDGSGGANTGHFVIPSFPQPSPLAQLGRGPHALCSTLCSPRRDGE
jgi:hypothetical protein